MHRSDSSAEIAYYWLFRAVGSAICDSCPYLVQSLLHCRESSSIHQQETSSVRSLLSTMNKIGLKSKKATSCSFKPHRLIPGRGKPHCVTHKQIHFINGQADINGVQIIVKERHCSKWNNFQLGTIVLSCKTNQVSCSCTSGLVAGSNVPTDLETCDKS